MRAVVVGDSGSGKTTVAAAIAARAGVPHVELDGLFHGPGWIPADTGVFRSRVRDLASTDGWAVDGNYPAVRDLLLRRATLVVWLDLPLHVTLPRLVRRTAARVLRQEELWNANRERLRDVLSPEHPIWWTLRRHRARRREHALLSDGRWVRLRSIVEVEAWLRTL